MKKKTRKMYLNRETLRNLESEALGAVVGGVTTSADPTACNVNSGCNSCGDTCGCPIETRRSCPV